MTANPGEISTALIGASWSWYTYSSLRDEMSTWKTFPDDDETSMRRSAFPCGPPPPEVALLLDCLRAPARRDAAAARQAWRRMVLVFHPDKRPHDFDAWAPEKRREWTGRFHAVQRAYEAVEAHVAALEGR